MGLWLALLLADHGSLMYLFLGDLGCMLYTGCFRWELGSDKARRAKQALLDELGGDTIIDVLYLEFWTTPIVAEQHGAREREEEMLPPRRRQESLLACKQGRLQHKFGALLSRQE
uniref:Uncharacterized protein n=1 Tax=Zea mays TaxID=4577 RepID=A0A804NCF6_MAIZE